MVRYLLPMRCLILLASLGALVGAIMMFSLAALKLVHGVQALWTGGSAAVGAVTASVMGATDALLFGIVLVVFAYATAYGLAFAPQERPHDALPAWMHVQGIGELKRTLVEVIIVYLIVDFATDFATGEALLAWPVLVKPVSILLIALALRLLGAPHPTPTAEADR